MTTTVPGTPSIFLTDEEVRRLTGYAQKAKQIEQLRRMGLPFFVNALKEPVVARTTVEGPAAPAAEKEREAWMPRVLREKK